MNLETLQNELATFADLGTELPALHRAGGRVSAKLHRDGELLRLAFENDGDGRVEIRRRGQRAVRPSFRTLLASEYFADLGRWIENQQRLLRPTKTLNAIQVKGTLDSGGELDVHAFSDFLARHREQGDMVRVVLIDGPAGVGKTKFIERLALERAEGFRRTHAPLILHVQSRGRVLTYLQDLIATSLQILRLSVTFDQVPILVRHGLVVLAIDGFDELGDPNGYDLAWNQVNEMVGQVRGEGTLILAGRDTFIGRERIESDITALQPEDEINALALRSPTPPVARKYLIERKGWPTSDDARELMDVLLEPDSYALRPFFLSRMDSDTIQPMLESATGNPLAYLIDTMVEREATKFGDAVETVMTRTTRENFIRGVLREVARTMADDQSEAISETELTWVVALVAGDLTEDEEVLRILKNRVIALAFLENDDDPRYRRFSSSQISNHFLAEETVGRVSTGEVPKYVRRNILGADFLSAFSDLVMHLSIDRPERVESFFAQAVEVAAAGVGSDRAPRNLGGLLLTCLPAMTGSATRSLQHLSVDEALIEETAPPTLLRNVMVNQLDVRGANVTELKFEGGSIHTLLVDGESRVSESLPLPLIVRCEGTSDPGTMTAPAAIESWLRAHGRGDEEAARQSGCALVTARRNNDFVRTLEKACRSRSFWIPVSGDDVGSRFAKSPAWPAVMSFLEECGKGRRVVRGVGGRQKYFFRIANRREVLALLWGSERDRKVRSFYNAIDKAIKQTATQPDD